MAVIETPSWINYVTGLISLISSVRAVRSAGHDDENRASEYRNGLNSEIRFRMAEELSSSATTKTATEKMHDYRARVKEDLVNYLYSKTDTVLDIQRADRVYNIYLGMIFWETIVGYITLFGGILVIGVGLCGGLGLTGWKEFIVLLALIAANVATAVGEEASRRVFYRMLHKYEVIDSEGNHGK